MTEAPENGRCFNCDIELDSGSYCFGCCEFVCDGENCEGAVTWSVASATGPGHEPEDHLIEAVEDEEEL